MEFFKSQYDRIQKQLAGLTASQRMLTAALVAIMIMTLVWWGRYAGEAEMEPVLNQSFAEEDIARITTQLASKGIHYTVAGDKVLVPADRRMEVLAGLSYSRLLPRNSQSGFDDMLKQMSPFESQSKTDYMANHGRELMLAQIIRGFPDVADAQVMIDPTREERIGASIDPSATVTIEMRSGSAVTQQLVNAAADVMEGAKSDLQRSKIKVVIDGVPRRLQNTDSPDDLSGAGSDLIELTQKNELRLENKIKDHLAYIQGLMVSVTVKLNTTAVQEQQHNYDGKGAVQKEDQTTSETEETHTPEGAPAAEPGVTSNTSLSIPTAGSASAEASTSREKTETKFRNFVPETQRTTKTPAGDATAVAATVRVPLSYFAAVFDRRNPGGKPAGDDVLQKMSADELPKIRNDVMKCTGLVSEKDVSVETYSDAMPLLASAAVPPQVAGNSVSVLLGGHAKDVMLGGLALVSLFMVSMMMKKNVPAPVLPAVAAPPAPTVLGAGELVAGEVGTADNMLDGMEMDEESVRAQQMIHQVSTMVGENPDAAANLVKRWLSRA